MSSHQLPIKRPIIFHFDMTFSCYITAICFHIIMLTLNIIMIHDICERVCFDLAMPTYSLTNKTNQMNDKCNRYLCVFVSSGVFIYMMVGPFEANCQNAYNNICGLNGCGCKVNRQNRVDILSKQINKSKLINYCVLPLIYEKRS